MKLSDYPFFLKGLDKIKGDDDIVKCLHMLMFSTLGKKLEAKKNIRLFSGFADEKKNQFYLDMVVSGLYALLASNSLIYLTSQQYGWAILKETTIFILC